MLLVWLASLNEMQLDLVVSCPHEQSLAGQLRAVVTGKGCVTHSIQGVCDIVEDCLWQRAI